MIFINPCRATDDGTLHYAGRAGTGMTVAELKRLAQVCPQPSLTDKEERSYGSWRSGSNP
jgi:hypothetical protein